MSDLDDRQFDKQMDDVIDSERRLRREVAQLRALLGKAATVAKVCSKAAGALRMASEVGALKDEHVRGFMVGVAQCLEDPESADDTFVLGGDT